MGVIDTPRTATPPRSWPNYPLLLAAGSALFAWLMPTHQPPWPSFDAELAMAVAVLLVGVWVLWRTRAALAVMPGLVGLTFVVALIPPVQCAAGIIPFRGDAALASLYLLGFALAQLVGHRATVAFGSATVLERFAWVVLAGALASVWLGLYQWLQLDYFGLYVADISLDRRPAANFNQPNLLATFLVLGLVATACLFDLGRIRAPTALLALGMLAFGLASTQSRAGLLEIPIGAGLLVLGRSRLNHRLQGRHAVVAAAVVLLMLALWEAVRHIGGESIGRDVSDLMRAGARVPHWLGMLDAIAHQPWLGYGWLQGAVAQFRVATSHPAAPGVFDYGHNLVLDLILWNGVPIGAAISIVLAYWFFRAWRETRESATFLALIAVVAVFVHALLEFPLYYCYFLLPVGLLMGGVSAAAPNNESRINKAFAPACFALAAGLLVILVSDYRGISEDVTALRFERARIGMGGPRRELSKPLLLTQMSAYTAFARTPERKGMEQPELDKMRAVVERFPSGPNLLRYAAALAINGQQIQASHTLEAVCQMNRRPVCEHMQSLWHGLGAREPLIAEVAWPTSSSQSATHR